MSVVMKLHEVPTRQRYEGNEGWITRLFVEENGMVKNAKDFGVFIQDAKAGSVPHDKTLHYHKKQETLYYILSGKCVVNVEGKEYELGPNSAIWIPPNRKTWAHKSIGGHDHVGGCLKSTSFVRHG